MGEGMTESTYTTHVLKIRHMRCIKSAEVWVLLRVADQSICHWCCQRRSLGSGSTNPTADEEERGDEHANHKLCAAVD